MKGLLRNLVANSANQRDSGNPFALGDEERLNLLDDYERTGLSWIWATDPEGRLIYVSPHATEQMERDPSELFRKQMSELFETDPDDSDRTDRSLQFIFRAHKKITDLPVRFCQKDLKAGTQERWWSLSGNPKFDQGGRFQGYRGSARDITIAYRRQREDSRLAEYDSLTGLANRHRMDRRLQSLLAAYKSAKRSCALMMLDLDRFKQVNDTMGHQAGDELLKQVAQRLQSVVADQGEIGRLGGDEFQVIIPDVDDRGKLGQLAEKLIKIVSQPYPIEGKRAIIGASVGMAIAPYDGIESTDLVHSADLALYSAKNGGRGQYRFYSSDLKDEEEVRAHLLDDLREALAQDQLQLHYQPVVRVSDEQVVGFEGLMRWDHPERGMVSPGLFIPVAEDSSLIHHLGEWALRRACEDASGWPGSVRVAVNVSAAQFRHSGFLSTVTKVLAHSGLSPDRLELELTESVFLGDSETVDETFRALKELGVRLALDDFGTGYSSLSYLRSAPFDKIKVDKSFVDSCTKKDQNSAKIIAAIIGLSNALGMETTVEGVEAFDQLEVVKEKGAKIVQGWIYSKAITNEEAKKGMESGVFRIKPDGPMKYRAERRSVFRRIGVIHEDHRYDAVMRSISAAGASVEGLLGVPAGTGLVLDLGGGQLVVCQVMRTNGALMGVEFETPLVSDGAGGLCTRHRVSPYALAAAGMPLTALPPGNYPLAQMVEKQGSKPQFMEVAVSRG